MWLAWLLLGTTGLDVDARHVHAAQIPVDGSLSVAAWGYTETWVPSLRSVHRHIDPLLIETGRAFRLGRGVSLRAETGLRISLWQSTDSAHPAAGELHLPLLACSSASRLKGGLRLLFGPDASLRLEVAVEDDPVHLSDGANCAGGSPVWMSRRYQALVAETALGAGWQLIGRVVRRAEQLHVRQDEGGPQRGDHRHDGVMLIDGREWLVDVHVARRF